ncbi:hypothetical protein [Streptomyces sp. NPDC005435]|uniref:hypothetical protein n=1 Tax=Streptomyces sp. NPDC005435 TaxID=3154464 RepID=UPI0034527E23
MDLYGQPADVTAEIVDWRLERHPQVPVEGDKVHFRFRFHGVDEFTGTALDVCAVDKKRVALGCDTVYSVDSLRPDGGDTADSWLTVDHPHQVTAVLLIPNDQHFTGRTCNEDPKDGGGPHPPESPKRGDQL